MSPAPASLSPEPQTSSQQPSLVRGLSLLDSGGQYIYLREAYGDLVAFLYGWMLFAVANGGTIAALSVASAAYMGNIIPAISQQHVMFSLAGIPFTRAHAVGLLLIVILTYV